MVNVQLSILYGLITITKNFFILTKIEKKIAKHKERKNKQRKNFRIICFIFYFLTCDKGKLKVGGIELR